MSEQPDDTRANLELRLTEINARLDDLRPSIDADNAEEWTSLCRELERIVRTLERDGFHD